MFNENVNLFNPSHTSYLIKKPVFADHQTINHNRIGAC